MTDQRSGDLYALMCAAVCGIGNIAAKTGLKNISTELFNFYFFLFAFSISLVMMLRKNPREDILNIKPKIAGLIFILSILFAAGLFAFMTALKMIEPATVSFLSRIEVVILIALAYFMLKEKLRLLEIIGGIVAIGGVIILKYQTNLEISKAATIMIISAFFFAGAEILVKRNIKKIGNAAFLFYRNLFTVILVFFFAVIRGVDFYIPDLTTLTMAFFTALLLPTLGRLTFLESMRRINVSRAILITQSTPLFTAVFAWLILTSLPGPTEWLGGALIVFGVLLVKLQREHPAAPIRY